MASAIEVLPVRSMVTVSSAFMSSMRARTRRRVSLASGRTLETLSGARRALARESADVGRGPFLSLAYATRNIGMAGWRVLPPAGGQPVFFGSFQCLFWALFKN